MHRSTQKGDYDMGKYILEALQELNKLEEMADDKSVILSQIRGLICHLLKCKYQPEYPHKRSWVNSIRNAQQQIESIILKSGSLRRFYNKADLKRLYVSGRNDAILETGKTKESFPDTCEWTLEQMADSTFIREFLSEYGKPL